MPRSMLGVPIYACLLDAQGDGNVVLLLRDEPLCREASIAYAFFEFVVCTVRARAYRHLRVASHRMHKSPRAPGVCVRDSRTSNVVVTGCLVRQKRDGICTQMRSSCARAALWANLFSSVIFWVRGALRMHDAAVLVLASCHES